MTINGARGCHPRIRDRFDLTVECIRRQYRKEPHPLSAVLGRYADFFALFDDFRGYVDFFLLQDLVSEDYLSVRFFLPFQDFAMPATPSGVDAYRTYWQHAVRFLESRNRRILALNLAVSIAAHRQTRGLTAYLDSSVKQKENVAIRSPFIEVPTKDLPSLV